MCRHRYTRVCVQAEGWRRQAQGWKGVEPPGWVDGGRFLGPHCPMAQGPKSRQGWPPCIPCQGWSEAPAFNYLTPARNTCGQC